MTRYQPKDPLTSPDFDHPWVRRRWEQLAEYFPEFLTSEDGRFYVLFGGRGAGKTSLLEIIRHRPPLQQEKSHLPILIDLKTVGTLSSSTDFFELLFKEIRSQLDICHIDPQDVARLFQSGGSAPDDFKQAFYHIVGSPESKVKGARLLLLLDNADQLALSPFVSELFADLVKMFSNPAYVRYVTSQLDIVVTGGVPLYNQLLKTGFAETKLKHWCNIEALPEDAAQALIAELPVIRDRPHLIKEILRHTGGQPYLLQCLMAQLEELAQRGQLLTSEIVEQMIQACLQPRHTLAHWFHDCHEAIEEQGACSVYAALATGQTMTWTQIEAAIQERGLGDTAPWLDPCAIDRALDALLFHGLVRHDQVGTDYYYTIASELFKQWFLNKALSPEERTKVAMSQAWAMSILTAAVPMLYDILKWLRKERERDQEEDIVKPPPPEPPMIASAEADRRPSAFTPTELLTVLRGIDLAAERAALDRLSSLGRQLKERQENINIYEEELGKVPVGRELINLRKGFGQERAEIERIVQEMQEIVERLSGHQVVVEE
jgi:hypothetical protein